MGYLSGSTGKILFVRADTKLKNDSNDGWKELPTRVQNWTLNTTANLLDTTSLGDYDKKSIYGIRTTSGTLRLFYYTDKEGSSPGTNSASWFFNALCRAADSAGEKDLPNYDNTTRMPRSNESIEVRLRLFLMEQTTTLRDFIDLDANLTSVSIGSAVNEVVAVDVAFEATVATKGNQADLRKVSDLPVRKSNL